MDVQHAYAESGERLPAAVQIQAGGTHVQAWRHLRAQKYPLAMLALAHEHNTGQTEEMSGNDEAAGE